MGSMTTKVYMNNSMAVSTNKNGNAVVGNFSADTELISTTNNPNNSNGPNPPTTIELTDVDDAVNSGNEAGESHREFPLPVGTGIVGAREE